MTTLDEASTRELIRLSLAEDLEAGPDVTSLATVDSRARATAAVSSRVGGTIAALDVIDWTLDAVVGDDYTVTRHAADGDRIDAGTNVVTIEAPTVGLLTAERTLLNLVTHASGIATATAAWVDAVAETAARIRDTRKTLPGMRNLQKYAVAAGGGVNHRMGLGDVALIKDNHVIAAGGVVPALRKVRALYPDVPCEVEVDTIEQFDDVLTERPEEILLDNFTPELVRVAVDRRNRQAPEVALEASGGLSIDRARVYAEAGADFLAVGALTHSVTVLDLGLDFRS